MFPFVSRIVHKAIRAKIQRRRNSTVAGKQELECPTAGLSSGQRLSSLCSLPGEVLITVLSLCDIGDLFTCSQVCRALEYLIRTELSLRYKILLAINGMVDGPPGPMSLSDRLGKLRVYSARCRSGPDAFWSTDAEPPQASWRAPEPLASLGVGECQLSFAGSTSYIFIQPLQNVIDIRGPAPGFVGDHHSMYHQTVPFALFPDCGVIRAASVDLSQDLLVVFQAKAADSETGSQVIVHLRSLRRPDVPHSCAVFPVLCAETSRPSPTGGSVIPSSIQIHQQYVAWLLSSSDGRSLDLEVWDWKAGLRLWHRRVSKHASFTLLDTSHLVVTSRSWGELRIYRFGPTQTTETRSHILALNLPSGISDCRIQESSIPCPPPSAPFWPDPALRILAVAISHSPVSNTKCGKGGLLIPYETFRTCIRQAATAPTLSMLLRKPVAWTEWGPRGSVLLSVPRTGTDWDLRNSYPFGSRIPLSLAAPAPDGLRGAVVVFDLNPWAAKYTRHAHMRSTQAQLSAFADPQAVFATKDASVRHAAHYFARAELDRHEGGVLAMDHDGFSAVRRQSNGRGCAVRVKSYFAIRDLEWPRGSYLHGSPINNRNDRALVRWSGA